MPASNLRYQTIQLDNRLPVSGGPSAEGLALGAGVKLLHKTMKALNGWSVSWRVNREVEKLAPRIEAAIDGVEQRHRQSRSDAGVLVVVGTQEWATPDPTGTRAQMFLELHLGGAGTNAATVLREYRSRPKLLQGPAQGWRRKDSYVWVTRTS